MKKQVIKAAVSVEVVQNKIFLIRGHKVMLDLDLANLYGVQTKRLNEQVKRNMKRFPEDFCFQLTIEEKNELVANCDRFRSQKHSTSKPYAFTEQGVAMLSSVLNSDRAIEVNIQIMRVFTKLREMIASHKDLVRKIEDLERKFQSKFNEHDRKFILIFEAIKRLMKDTEEEGKKKGPMGFQPPRHAKLLSLQLRRSPAIMRT